MSRWLKYRFSKADEAVKSRKQAELAKQFKKSLIPVREALKQLEVEGLVKFYPNRGATVTALSADEVREIFEIRVMLEIGVLKIAIPKMSPVEIEKARSIINKTERETNVGEWCRLNWGFHSTLYAAAERPRLMTIIKNLNMNIERYLRIYLFEMKYQPKSQREHKMILDACEKKDIRCAIKVLKQHIDTANELLVKYIDQTVVT